MYVSPDYPMPGTYGSFISNTYMGYEQPQTTQFMFYPGFGAQPQQEIDSRRTPPTPTFAPVMQPMIPQMTQPQPSPFTQQIQPFSAYGGSGTQMSAPLSSPMADSRRYQPTAPATNPWAAPLAPTATVPAVPQQPQWDFQMQQQMSQSQYGTTDSRLAPLVSGFQVPGFDKRVGVWDNPWTTTRPFPQPNVQWNQQQQNAQTFVPVNQMPVSPFNQPQQTMYQQSWTEQYNNNRAGGF